MQKISTKLLKVGAIASLEKGGPEATASFAASRDIHPLVIIVSVLAFLDGHCQKMRHENTRKIEI